MKLSDDETILFAAMMYLGGLNESRGNNREALADMPAEDIRKAKEVAAREFPVFKREARKRRTN